MKINRDTHPRPAVLVPAVTASGCRCVAVLVRSMTFHAEFSTQRSEAKKGTPLGYVLTKLLSVLNFKTSFSIPVSTHHVLLCLQECILNERSYAWWQISTLLRTLCLTSIRNIASSKLNMVQFGPF